MEGWTAEKVSIVMYVNSRKDWGEIPHQSVEGNKPKSCFIYISQTSKKWHDI